MFGRTEALAGLVGPNHFFQPTDSIPATFEHGFQQHEAAAGFVAFMQQYLPALLGQPAEMIPRRATVVAAFERMTELELPLQVASPTASPTASPVGLT